MTDDDTGSTAAKTTKPKARKPAAKTVTKAVVPEPVPAIESPAPLAAVAPVAVVGADLRKKELIERVAKIVGGKKGGVKEIVEATLAVLGDALAKGEGLNLPPLGRAKVNRQKDTPSGPLFMVKLRRSGEKPADDGSMKKPRKEALADADE